MHSLKLVIHLLVLPFLGLPFQLLMLTLKVDCQLDLALNHSKL